MRLSSGRNYQDFWAEQNDSRHRSSSDDFFSRKAREFMALVNDEDSEGTFTDCGCGAGELLAAKLKHGVKIPLAFDYSESMLEAARTRLQDSDTLMLVGDWRSALPKSESRAWMTTGALNQYLDETEQAAFLDFFFEHQSVRSLYLMDCVDPILLAAYALGGGYLGRRPPRLSSRLLLLVRAYVRLLQSALFNQVAFQLPGRGMGYGFLPAFWLKLVANRRCSIEICSSLLYEYRYHVVIRKL